MIPKITCNSFVYYSLFIKKKGSKKTQNNQNKKEKKEYIWIENYNVYNIYCIR